MASGVAAGLGCVCRCRGKTNPTASLAHPPAGLRTQKVAASAVAATATAAAPKRPKKPRAAPPLPRALRPVVQDGAWLRAQQARLGFLCDDMSGGVEVRKIPAFNEVDDEPLPQLQYVR